MSESEGRICTTCKEFKHSQSFYLNKYKKLRAECKECANSKSLSIYHSNRNVKNSEFYASRLASRAIQRCSNDHEVYKHYRENNIECKFPSHKVFADYIFDNFSNDIDRLLDEGKVPSLDRIDPSGHYVEGNLRVIDVVDNRALGSATFAGRNSKALQCVTPNGEIRGFGSVMEAHLQTGLDRATIRSSFTNGKKTRSGYTFIQIETEAE